MNKTAWAIVAFFVLGGAVFVWFASRPSSEPPAQTMTSTDTSGLAKGEPIVQVALPAELSSEAQIGKRAFEARCAQCHGANAAGQNGVAPPLVHKIYEPSHHADMAFLRAAKTGVRAHHWRFGDMPPVEGVTDAEVKYITRYVRELQKENGIF
jgi:mono/diheme cytochrome c family protein